MSVTNTTGSTSSAPISFSGLASGINTSSIIQKLLSIDQQPITDLQDEVTADQAQQQIYTQLQGLVQSFQQAAAALNQPSAFTTVQANSSNTSAATITTTGNALPGSYNLSITQVAQAQVISSAAQASTTSALGLSGTIVLNGKSLSVGTNDTLTSIAQGINGLNAGVTASIINGGQGNSYITLTASNTGAANAIQLGDMTGNVLQSLGFTNGTEAIRSPITNGAQSYGLSSSTATLQSLLGASTSGSITINGTSVNVDFSTDSLQSIANNINTNVSGVNASVQAVTNNGQTTYQLQVTSTATPLAMTDSNGILQSIGLMQQGVSNPVVPAKDAAFSINNVNLTSPTNTVTTAIPGATINLLQGTAASPGTSTLSLTQNTSGIITSLQTFASAYNAVNDFINQESQFNATTYASGPLFGDPVADQIQTMMSSTLFQTVGGSSSQYNNLFALGFSLNSTGDLALDTDTATAALNSDPTDVAKLFEATGQGSNSDLSYVMANGSTVASGNNPYAVNITQLPTESSYVAGTVQTEPASNSETLTFGGALFNSTPVSLILNVGASLSDTVSQINADPQLNSLITASINGSTGALELDAKKYGSIGAFTVSSNLAAGPDNSGIGDGTTGTMTTGLDIAGTINGEAATGQGQFLTGNSGNPTTSGLEIQYTGTQTGIVGTMSYSSGVANLMSNLATSFSDPNTGLIADEGNALTAQITSYQSDITNLQAQLVLEQQNLTNEFNAMETAIAQLQSQGSALGAMNLAANGSSSSSSSGSSSSSSNSSNSSSSGL
jgi:flagellar hook-associated protein 2